MKVKNVTGTSGRTCNCSDWLTHWEDHSGKKAGYCGEKTCMKATDLVGAHVRKIGSTDNIIYILPLCKSHNQSTDELEVHEPYPLVREDACK